ncbi:transglycosylase domain-containing protein [Frisingicoccus sp.]|uniref:transglycosylase domain-containing protein n=1 Tax=Frisingicoccus sp. TaxID=1918627 RepID=UPI002EAAC0C5|nr:transglycosylase domain-containing protein [Frisingicoccus sp.]
MDYSKHGTRKKEKHIRSGVPKAKHKVSFNIFRIFIFALLIVGVAGVAAAIGGLRGVIDSAPVISVEDVLPEGYKSFIYDRDGNLLTELYQPETNRVPVKIDQIPEVLQNAFIALEDSRFREHNGIDPQGIVRAFFVGITSGNFSEGASTITQQLLKLSVFGGGGEDSLLLKFKRKFQEQYLALELEKNMTKDEILEAYLNTINLGASTYGVEAASQRYFGKSCSEVTASEAAVLASIAKSPTYYDPIYYPESNAERREKTLNDMLEQGYLTQAEYDEAMADDVYARIAAHAEEKSTQHKVFTYYEDAAIRQVLEDLENELGYTSEQAINKLYGGGLKVYLAQDNAMQQIVDEEYADNNNFNNNNALGLEWRCSVLEEDGTTSNYDHMTMQYWYWNNENSSFRLIYNNEEEAWRDINHYKEALGITEENTISEYFYQPYAMQSSFVLMDQYNGQVKAIAGGRNEKQESLSFSRETQSTRQPGSCFKILACFLPGIDGAGLTLASSTMDAPYKTSLGYSPQNWYGGYWGLTTVRKAITWSMNVVTTKFFVEKVTPSLAIDYCRKLGITTLTDDDYVESLALGGLTYGVTNLEMTGAYAAIANGGTYVRPVFYTKVVDRDGNVILDTTNQHGERVIKETTAFLLTSAMEDVVTSGTGTAANTYDGVQVAGKTGTTTDSKDLWFVGYTPYLTAGIWLGYDQAYEMEGDLRENEHSYLWSKIMRRIDAELGYESASFSIPDGIGTRTVCSKSGKLVGTSACTGVTEYFDLSALPSGYCNDHIFAEICKQCGKLAGENTLTENRETKEFDSESDIPKGTCDCKPITADICTVCGGLAGPNTKAENKQTKTYTSQADVPTNSCTCQPETQAPATPTPTPEPAPSNPSTPVG